MRQIKYFLSALILISIISSCTSLEDTYKEYAGDGEIRYIGKCTDLAVSPGWNRLIVSWKNSVDPLISNVKVTWKENDNIKEILLDKDIEEYSIDDLEDKNYEWVYNTNQWKYSYSIFYFYSAPGATGIKNLNDSKVTVTTTKGTINIECEEGSLIRVFNTNGALVGQNEPSIYVEPGTYIVKVNSKTFKVVCP